MWEMFDIDWWGLVLPSAYVMVLGGALMTFSSIYRKRRAGVYTECMSSGIGC